MLRNLNGLTGLKIRARDGELGEALEFYFEDTSWKVRYLVARTGGPGGREVLISPVAVKSAGGGAIEVDLTVEQVRNSPDIDTDKTVTRRHERELHEYYAWPLYWGEAFYGGSMSGSPLFIEPPPRERAAPEEGDAHLQSTRDVAGYGLHAADGHLGHVRDYIVDDGWNIRYLVADTGVWLPGRKVLISPHWIESVNWETSEIYVDLTREAVRMSPGYDPSVPVSEDYESELFDHYGRPKLGAGAGGD